MYTIQFIRLAYYTIKLIYKRWSWDVNVCTYIVYYMQLFDVQCG